MGLFSRFICVTVCQYVIFYQLNILYWVDNTSCLSEHLDCFFLLLWLILWILMLKFLVEHSIFGSCRESNPGPVYGLVWATHPVQTSVFSSFRVYTSVNCWVKILFSFLQHCLPYFPMVATLPSISLTVIHRFRFSSIFTNGCPFLNNHPS